MSPSDVKRLAKDFQVPHPTLSGWVNNGMPDTIRKAFERILELEHQLYWLKRELDGTLR